VDSETPERTKRKPRWSVLTRMNEARSGYVSFLFTTLTFIKALLSLRRHHHKGEW